MSRFKLFCSSDAPTLSLCLICLILLASGDHALGTSNSFHHYREAGTDGKEGRLSGLLVPSPAHEKNRVFEEAGARPHEFQSSDLRSGAGDRLSNLAFTHLTTGDGLSQGYVTAILQDRRGFMWFATRDGLNRYDGNSFVVYKNKANDPDSLSSNFIQDLMEDNQGYLWIATDTGVDKFDAFRHAEAKQIEVEIHYDDQGIRVAVRDDGKGIDQKLLSDGGREGHFGLRGMRERAKLIGGKLTVWSAGTEVELSIPGSRAYATIREEGRSSVRKGHLTQE